MSERGVPGPVLRGKAIGELRHELRTPVNAILGYGEMLLEDLPEHEAPLAEAVAAAREVLSRIEQALPPSNDAVGAAELTTLGECLCAPRERIVRAADALLAASGDGIVAADVRRIREAADRIGELLKDPAGFGAAPPQTAKAVGDAMADAETIVGPSVAAHAEHTSTAPVPAGAARILVVDDVEDNRTVLERRLLRDGHVVECAVDGRDALQKIARTGYDLVLLDIMMPEVDGFEVLTRLKGSPETRDIPVIMISALDDIGSVVRCIEQGAEDRLTKPFEPVLLRARVNASLDKKRLRDREREYLSQVKAIADAAMAVEEGTYQSSALSAASVRKDELGRLARVFDGMASEVKAREQRLRRQVLDLRLEIDAARRMAGAVPGEDINLPVGHVLADRYKVLDVLGFGAMGTVYKAYDADLAEVVAVKVLRPELLSDPAVLDRFKAEVRLARRISHPAVVRTHDLGESGGTHFLTMEFVEGMTARALVDSRGQLGVSAVLAIGTQLAEALSAAHAQGVIHRDIKPHNMLLNGQGMVKVMDFGVSKLVDHTGAPTEAGLMIGTPAYMAPEQLMAEDIDARADLYATGVVLFECLTGRLPFDAPSPMALVAKVLREEPPPALAPHEATPPGLSAIIARLLAKRPDDRPSSAQELVGLLAQVS